jgi:hypothetical protein
MVILPETGYNLLHTAGPVHGETDRWRSQLARTVGLDDPNVLACLAIGEAIHGAGATSEARHLGNGNFEITVDTSVGRALAIKARGDEAAAWIGSLRSKPVKP